MTAQAMLRLTALSLLAGLAACQGSGEAGNNAAATDGNAIAPPANGETIVTAIAADGKPHRFIVEIALDEESQQQGLMGRTALADDRGMLFPFPYPQTISFWMKDTPLALDLLFIRPDGTIAAILPGKPNDLSPISAGEPVSAVLEIAGGRAKTLGLSAGDRVSWGDCTGEAAKDSAWRADRFCPPPAR